MTTSNFELILDIVHQGWRNDTEFSDLSSLTVQLPFSEDKGRT